MKADAPTVLADAQDIETLLFVLFSDRTVSAEDIGRNLGSEQIKTRSGWYAAGVRCSIPLIETGLIAKPHADRFAITEKGRLAAALLLAKDSALRAAWMDPA